MWKSPCAKCPMEIPAVFEGVSLGLREHMITRFCPRENVGLAAIRGTPTSGGFLLASFQRVRRGYPGIPNTHTHTVENKRKKDCPPFSLTLRLYFSQPASRLHWFEGPLAATCFFLCAGTPPKQEYTYIYIYIKRKQTCIYHIYIYSLRILRYSL